MVEWCSGTLSSVAEGGVSSEVRRKDLSGRCELFTDKPEPKEPASHGVLFVVGNLGVRARRLDLFRHLAECETELNVCLQAARVDPALLAIVGILKLEEAELDRLSEYSGKRSYPNKIFIRRL